jgi:NADH-quinone oxidoreductase subunit G
VEYNGYELNDLMKALVDAPALTIDWTQTLPTDRGFKAVSFDSLPNAFTNEGVDNRGYTLETSNVDADLPEVAKFDEDAVLDGEIAYRCNPARQFNDFTDKSHEIFETFALYASVEKAESLGGKVEVVFDNGSITLDVVADEKILGDIVKVPDFKAALGVYDLFGESRYKTVTLRKV